MNKLFTTVVAAVRVTINLVILTPILLVSFLVQAPLRWLDWALLRAGTWLSLPQGKRAMTCYLNPLELGMFRFRWNTTEQMKEIWWDGYQEGIDVANDFIEGVGVEAYEKYQEDLDKNREPRGWDTV
ncbi:MAG TPA: hypothetical protein V6D20_24690 [Candidatus Obscuribacterales bacterium]